MILNIRDKKPQLHEDTWIADNAVVAGDVFMDEGSSVFFSSTIRADFDSIKIGKFTNIQDNCVLHESEDFPITIGDYSTIGHGATLHGCTIGNNVMIGMGSVILNGAVIGDNSIVGAHTLVTSGKEIPPNSLVVGSPGKIVRQVTEEEINSNRHNAELYIENARIYKASLAKDE